MSAFSQGNAVESTEFRSLRSSEILRLRRLLPLCAGERKERLEHRLAYLEAKQASLSPPAAVPGLTPIPDIALR